MSLNTHVSFVVALRSFGFALILTAIAFGHAYAAPAASNERALLVPIDRLVLAIDAGSAGGIAAAYVAAPTIVDEFAPFHWSRDGAARQWFRDFSTVARSASLTHIRVVRHAPTYVSFAGPRAWLVIPTDYHYDAAGKPQTESAAWTFVLLRERGSWRIEASTWAKTAGAA